jgi:hypothetical protein
VRPYAEHALQPNAPRADHSDVALSTRLVVLIIGALGVTAAGLAVWTSWQVLALLFDPILWFLGFIAAPIVVVGGVQLLGAVPQVVGFYRSFCEAHPSAYWGGYVPAVALLAPALAVAVVGGPPKLWAPAAALGAVIVVLLALPSTRRDFGL